MVIVDTPLRRDGQKQVQRQVMSTPAQAGLVSALSEDSRMALVTAQQSC